MENFSLKSVEICKLAFFFILAVLRQASLHNFVLKCKPLLTPSPSYKRMDDLVPHLTLDLIVNQVQ